MQFDRKTVFIVQIKAYCDWYKWNLSNEEHFWGYLSFDTVTLVTFPWGTVLHVIIIVHSTLKFQNQRLAPSEEGTLNPSFKKQPYAT